MLKKVSEREEKITAYVNMHGFVNTAELAEYFELTPQSIRRYLKALHNKGDIIKTHGGVMSKNIKNPNTLQDELANNQSNTIKIESLTLICFEPKHSDTKFFNRLDQFLKKYTRIDPVIHRIIETTNCSWASNETDKLLRKINRKQVAIFIDVVTETAINKALISHKRKKQTFLIYQKYKPETVLSYELKQQGVRLLSFENFKSDWIYAHI